MEKSNRPLESSLDDAVGGTNKGFYPETKKLKTSSTFVSHLIPRQISNLSSLSSTKSDSVTADRVDSVIEDKVEQPAVVTLSSLREPLRFSFTGYTIWLELEQFPLVLDADASSSGITTVIEKDLEYILETAAIEEGLHKIPLPHVTLLYGMNHHSVDKIRSLFTNEFRTFLNNSKGWPCPLKSRGVLCDITYDGVNGENMDIAWTEITLSSSADQEQYINKIYELFYGIPRDKDARWTPHLSLLYDNPEETILNLRKVVELVSRYPALLKERRVEAVSLWDTNGTMCKWNCLDRIVL